MRLARVLGRASPYRKIDAKCRFVMPAEIRKAAGNDYVCVRTPKTPGSLLILTQSLWDTVIDNVGDDLVGQKNFALTYYTTACAVSCDPQGRIPIYEWLRPNLLHIGPGDVAIIFQSGIEGLSILYPSKLIETGAFEDTITLTMSHCWDKIAPLVENPYDLSQLPREPLLS